MSTRLEVWSERVTREMLEAAKKIPPFTPDHAEDRHAAARAILEREVRELAAKHADDEYLGYLFEQWLDEHTPEPTGDPKNLPPRKA